MLFNPTECEFLCITNKKSHNCIATLQHHPSRKSHQLSVFRVQIDNKLTRNSHSQYFTHKAEQVNGFLYYT